MQILAFSFNTIPAGEGHIFQYPFQAVALPLNAAHYCFTHTLW